MDQNKYWQSFSGRTNSQAFQDASKDEFKEELPFEDGSLLDATTPRRDFLKYVGFSTAAAAIAAGRRRSWFLLGRREDIGALVETTNRRGRQQVLRERDRVAL